MNEKDNCISFINDVHDADVWILPRTKENCDTMLWGTPTLPKVAVGEKRDFQICEPGNNGLYLFRMIDSDDYFYSVDRLKIPPHATVRIREDEDRYDFLDILGENGELIEEYEVFAAML